MAERGELEGLVRTKEEVEFLFTPENKRYQGRFTELGISIVVDRWGIPQRSFTFESSDGHISLEVIPDQVDNLKRLTGKK